MTFFDIIDALPDPFDYEAFLALAETADFAHAITKSDYANRVGPIAVYIGQGQSSLEAWTQYQSELFDGPAPSLIAQAGNAASAVFGWVRAGTPSRTAEEVARIKAICASCDRHQKVLFGFIRCSAAKGGCGCLADFKGRMKTEHCPLERW